MAEQTPTEQIPQLPSREFLQKLEVRGDPTDAEAWELAAVHHVQSVRHLAQMGHYLRILKTRLRHGDFLLGLDGLGIDRRRASEAIRVCTLLQQQGEQLGLWDLSPTKLVAIASIDTEVLESAVERGEFELDDLHTWPVRRLQDEVLRLRRQSDTAKAQAEHWREVAALAERRGGTAPDVPDEVARARLEGAAAAEQAITMVQSLQAHLRALPRTADQDVRNGVVRTLWQHAGAVQAYLADLLHELRDGWGAGAPGTPAVAPLANEEIDALRDAHRRFLRGQELSAAVREEERARRGEIRRKPGRPRKPPPVDLLPKK